MLFNPQESIDVQGNTGRSIQHTHDRIQSILRRASYTAVKGAIPKKGYTLLPAEREIINLLGQYPGRIADAAEQFAPSLISDYAYDLAKAYNQFYAEVSIFSDPDPQAVAFRIALSECAART